MFAWYRDATVCYAYLADFCKLSDHEHITTVLRRCRWFTRGWTLQELLAPTDLIFYSADWEDLGSKQSLAADIHYITRIPEDYITGNVSIFRASVAHRMSWVSQRVTTRPEDLAYCMLGIFDINMPLLYGEGRKAFIRLQQEIMKDSADETLFCWTSDNTVPVDWVSMLAPTPSCFTHSNDFISSRLLLGRVSPYSVTNHGLSIRLLLFAVKGGFLGLLNVLALAEDTGAVAIFLQGDLKTGIFTRARYPLSPVRLLQSWVKSYNYLKTTRDSEQNIFVRMKADTVQMFTPFYRNIIEGGSLTQVRSPDQNSSYEILLIFGGSSSVYELATLPVGRLVQGCILSFQAGISSSSHQVDHLHDMDGVILQISEVSKPKALLFFGVKRQRGGTGTVWFCKVLDPDEGVISSFPNGYVKRLVKKCMLPINTSQVSHDFCLQGVNVSFGQEFDAGYGHRMRAAHIDIEFFKLR